MNYNEAYEVQQKSGKEWVLLHAFDREHKAVEYMEMMAHGAGTWRVVRVSEVTVATIAKA